MRRLFALPVVFVALLTAGCGSDAESGAGTATTPERPATTTEPERQSVEEREEEADAISTAIGEKAFCYWIGSIPFRRTRHDLYQCELAATGAVDCYVREGGKPVQVDALLSRKAAFEGLEESAVEVLGCLES
ncbi:MAG: hypothetical protein ABR583_08115 [Gaiellaceae bacterium]